MMTINKDSITTKITLDELLILECLLSEQEAYLKENISTVDEHKFIKLLTLRGKISSLIYLIKNNKSE